jgi:phosphoribosyl 1,2-cyclic phosphodiesterase
MKFSILSSGSKQNCFYIESEGSAILIDIGLHYNVMREFLDSVGGAVSKIQALFVTHEHWDHIQGIRSFLKNSRIPVYMDEESRKTARLKLPDHRPVIHGETVEVGDLKVRPFQVSHDAVHTYGYEVSSGGVTLALASDIGSYDDEILPYFRNAHAIAIESNYDPEMLKNSHYPAYLKRRINGKNGHLSNDDAVEFLAKTLSKRTKNVFFLHLSENNNTRTIVENMIDSHLSLRYPGVRFHISSREKPTSLVEL